MTILSIDRTGGTKPWICVDYDQPREGRRHHHLRPCRCLGLCLRRDGTSLPRDLCCNCARYKTPCPVCTLRSQR